MWGSVVFGFVAAIALVWGLDEGKIVKGQWYVDAVIPCPNEDKYPYTITAKKTKMNRTHDWFNVKMNLRDEITDQSHGAYIEFCKKTDGGCKIQYTISPSSICGFAREFGGENFPAVLNNMGVENGDCPIPKGELELKDFLLNYKVLPEEATPDEYTVTALILRGSEKMLCLMMDVTFTESDDEDDDD